ncbi:hypothetical protein E0Z10_g7751 [Xylaria hypoxylon]|uniref:Uncharacterized protein n=1 Tax=Xylaria hypoxylon TaxID=37992 RepID=A0A4Z0YNJ5_9PEZI|nr:hypothetical protein E0Z10_g7751 [Xylaria hypoxylon]
MATSSETIVSFPSREDTLPSPFDFEQGREVRKWSQFELDTVCSLICKHEHLCTSKEELRGHSRRDGEDPDDRALRFATKLNETLNGVRYKHDILVADVRELMDFIETKNRTVMAYIERQSTPFRVTRSKKYAFRRLCNTFNSAFRKWAIICRERRRCPSNKDDEEISGLSWIDRYLSSQNKDNYLLGATRIQKNAQLFENTERGWISNSVYARRSCEGPYINTTSGSGLDPNAHSLQRHALSAKHSFRLHHRNRHRIQAFPPPPPPPLSSPGPPTQYGQVEIQPFEAYDMAIHEGTEAETHIHSSRPAYHDYPDPIISAPPYSPASPALYGYADLRQTIHPTGPKPNTPMAIAMTSPAYHRRLPPAGSTLGSLTLLEHASPYSPMHMGYKYPEPPQDNENFNYSGILEAPTSPSSPIYMPSAASAVIGANTGGQSSVEPVCENPSGNDFYLASGGYRGYSLDY